MGRRPVLWLLVLMVSFTWVSGKNSGSLAVEKLKYGSAPRESIIQNLPVFAALDRGFWKENGLEISWVRTGSSRDLFRGIISGDLEMATTIAPSVVQGVVGGLPIKIISDLHKDSFSFWVITDSRITKPEHIKGAKIGVLGMGTTAHAYGRMVAKALGLEKEVRFVASGSTTNTVAALVAGAIDASVSGSEAITPLKVAGRVRELVNVDDYRPKEWLAYVHFASKMAAGSRPEVMKKANRAILQATRFILEDRSWTIEKIKQEFHWSEEAARDIYARLSYSKTGRSDAQALRNVANLLIEFGIVPKEKVPRLEDIYTNEFLS